MKAGDHVTLTELGRKQGFIGKHGNQVGVVVAVRGLAVKVLRDGYRQPSWFHRDFWRKQRSKKATKP